MRKAQCFLQPGTIVEAEFEDRARHALLIRAERVRRLHMCSVIKFSTRSLLFVLKLLQWVQSALSTLLSCTWGPEYENWFCLGCQLSTKGL